MREVIEKITSAKSVAILPHIIEDGDAIGSSIAAARMLRSMGKEAIVYVSGDIEDRLRFIGEDYIMYDPQKDINHDLCLCLDCADPKRLGERINLFEKIGNTANIDHHYTNMMYAQANYVEGSASSTGEVLYKLFKEIGVKPDKEAAACLYAAISSDTGSFKFSSVSSETMRIGADLLEYGIEHDAIARALFDTYTLDEVKIRAEVMGGIESYADGKVKIVQLTEDTLKKYGIDEKNAPSIVDIPRSIEGTEIAVAIKEIKGEIRVNLRSNSYVDVAKIAAEFGGGGHKRAAGFRVRNGVLNEVKKRLTEICLLEI